MSQARPCWRASQPMPPPRVSPPTPVCETLPAVVARPCGWAARSSAPSSAPPCTYARRGLRGRPAPAHRRQVDHQAVLGDGEPDHAVPAAAHADLEVEVAGGPDGGHHVADAGAADDQPRPAVDHGVPDRAGWRRSPASPGARTWPSNAVAEASAGGRHGHAASVAEIGPIGKVRFRWPNPGPIRGGGGDDLLVELGATRRRALHRQIEASIRAERSAPAGCAVGTSLPRDPDGSPPTSACPAVSWSRRTSNSSPRAT